jgi:hypothetical protein
MSCVETNADRTDRTGTSLIPQNSKLEIYFISSPSEIDNPVLMRKGMVRLSTARFVTAGQGKINSKPKLNLRSIKTSHLGADEKGYNKVGPG